MIPLFAPDDVRALDERTIAAGTPARVLMERAATALARAVIDTGGRAYGLRAGIVCGKGSNGGDGIAAARTLARAGAAPRVWLAAPEHELTPDCAWQLERWRREGGRLETDLGRMLAHSDIVVDCLLGTGGSGAPRGAVADAITAINHAGLPVVACDGPSGVDAATGAVAECAIRADCTVVIGAEKLGLRLWPAREHCGRIVSADIGLDLGAGAPSALLTDDTGVRRMLPPLDPAADKRGRGVVLVVAGSEGMAGAAVLTVRGALAGGAGLVTLAAPPAVTQAAGAAAPEALTLSLASDGDERVRQVLANAGRCDAIVLGPGLGTDAETVRMVRAVVAGCTVPMVCDADALNAFSEDGDALAIHAAPLLVLTPHRRELARLAGRPDDEVWPRRARLVPQLAARWNAVLLAKGPGTLVAAPDGRAWVVGSGSPALATGGTGDVLAGLIGALLARGGDAEVVAVAAHLHGRAGEAVAAGQAGGVGPLAVAASLPGVLQAIGDAV